MLQWCNSDKQEWPQAMLVLCLYPIYGCADNRPNRRTNAHMNGLLNQYTSRRFHAASVVVFAWPGRDLQLLRQRVNSAPSFKRLNSLMCCSRLMQQQMKK